MADPALGKTIKGRIKLFFLEKNFTHPVGEQTEAPFTTRWLIGGSPVIKLHGSGQVTNVLIEVSDLYQGKYYYFDQHPAPFNSQGFSSRIFTLLPWKGRLQDQSWRQRCFDNCICFVIRQKIFLNLISPFMDLPSGELLWIHRRLIFLIRFRQSSVHAANYSF